MISWLFPKLRRCKHSYQYAGREVVGTTLSWAATPTRQFTFRSICTLCGHQKKKTGMIIPGDRDRNPDYYDESGWPIDENGQRLEIAK